MIGSRTLETYIADDCPATILWDYQPYEPMEENYPGCQETATLVGVLVNGFDIIEVLSKTTIDGLQEKCLEAEAEWMGE